MRLFPWLELMIVWFAWLYPFIFKAPHWQKRQSITASGPTYAGLFFECVAIFLAFAIRLPADSEPGILRILAAAILGIVAAVLSWSSIRHLGRQFRIRAGLYEGHELIMSGPYSVVRHPIYASLLCVLLCTLLLLTPWKWIPLSLASFFLGTEIRVRTEDNLLASRFEDQFHAYQNCVPAYIPFIR